MQRHNEAALDTALGRLVAHARSAGAPERVADEARRATAARFTADGRSQRVAEPRMESYFWGVVRRSALAGRAPAIARLMVASSLAAELREAGHPADVVARATI